MNKEYIFKSFLDGKVILTINNGLLSIKRPGLTSTFYHGLSGEKSILIKNISSIQIKKAGVFQGYIQISIAGSAEQKSGAVREKKDENIIYFDSRKSNPLAEEIKKYVENYNADNAYKNIPNTSEDKYDKLIKLKKLLDNNIISQEEFDKEKTNILKNK